MSRNLQEEIDGYIEDLEYADNRIARLEDLLGRWRRAFRLQCGDNSPLLLDTNAEIGPGH